MKIRVFGRGDEGAEAAPDSVRPRQERGHGHAPLESAPGLSMEPVCF